MATLRQVERFAVSFALGDVTKTLILATTLLDTSKAFLAFGVRVDDPDSGQYLFSGEITNTTTLTFRRDASGPTAEIVGYVSEFTAGVSVDRGTLTSSATPGGPYTAILSNVTDLSKAFVFCSRHRGGSGYGDDDTYTARLFDDAGTKKVEIFQQRDNVGATYKWQAIQYDNCSVQRGSASMVSGAASATAALSAVDLNKSMVVFYHREDNGTTSNIAQKLLRGRFTSSTQLTFDRDSTGVAISDIRWEAVEFTDSVTVQEKLSSFAATDGQNDVSITAVSGLDKAVVVASDETHRGKGNRTTDDVLGEGTFTLDLTSTTNLQIGRAATIGSADVAAYVVDFGASGGGAVGQPMWLRRGGIWMPRSFGRGI